MSRSAVRFLVLALAAGPAVADDRYDPRYDDDYYYSQHEQYAQDRSYADQAPAYDTARVLSVDPIVERSRSAPRQECWNEPAPSYAQADPYRQSPPYREQRTSGGGAVIGAIIGGLIGNAVVDNDRHYYRGHHGRRYYYEDNDRAAATVAGALIGGAIGNGIERSSQRQASQPYAQDAAYRSRTVQRCRTVAGYEGEARVQGYIVTYEYAGRRYQTVTDYHPGSTLPVQVDVRPQP